MSDETMTQISDDVVVKKTKLTLTSRVLRKMNVTSKERDDDQYADADELPLLAFVESVAGITHRYPASAVLNTPPRRSMPSAISAGLTPL